MLCRGALAEGEEPGSNPLHLSWHPWRAVLEPASNKGQLEPPLCRSRPGLILRSLRDAGVGSTPRPGGPDEGLRPDQITLESDGEAVGDRLPPLRAFALGFLSLQQTKVRRAVPKVLGRFRAANPQDTAGKSMPETARPRDAVGRRSARWSADERPLIESVASYAGSALIQE